MSNRYRSKPSEVEAVRWMGDNYSDVEDFVPIDYHYLDRGGTLYLLAGKDGAQGRVPVPEGHWVVRSADDNSDYWPVDNDYFIDKYEAVEDE